MIGYIEWLTNLRPGNLQETSCTFGAALSTILFPLFWDGCSEWRRICLPQPGPLLVVYDASKILGEPNRLHQGYTIHSLSTRCTPPSNSNVLLPSLLYFLAKEILWEWGRIKEDKTTTNRIPSTRDVFASILLPTNPSIPQTDRRTLFGLGDTSYGLSKAHQEPWALLFTLQLNARFRCYSKASTNLRYY